MAHLADESIQRKSTRATEYLNKYPVQSNHPMSFFGTSISDKFLRKLLCAFHSQLN